METTELVSKCCFAPATGLFNGRTLEDGGRVTWTCTDCGDPCVLRNPPCPLHICDGSGECPNIVFDPDSYQYYQDGTVPCPHTL